MGASTSITYGAVDWPTHNEMRDGRHAEDPREDGAHDGEDEAVQHVGGHGCYCCCWLDRGPRVDDWFARFACVGGTRGGGCLCKVEVRSMGGGAQAATLSRGWIENNTRTTRWMGHFLNQKRN